jgi:hypothetical protein
MSIFRRSKFSPTKRLTRRRMLFNLVRNSWVLRRELWRLIRRKKDDRPAPIPLRCVSCKHELTKPCIRGRTKHLVKWPAEADGLGGHAAGTYVEIARQKPRSGQLDKDYDLEAKAR